MNPLFRTELKGVVKLAIVEAGGQENCANVSGRIRRPAAFSDYANVAVGDRHIPLDVAVELDAFNGNGRIIRAAAAMLDLDLVPRAQVAARGDQVEALIHAARESAEALDTSWQAISDRQLTQAERRKISCQFDEAIVAMVQARRAFEAGGCD